MHIAVDAHNLLVDRRGIGVYIRAVLSRLLRREDLHVTLLVNDIFPGRLRRKLAAELGDTNPKAFGIAKTVPHDANVVWHPWNGTFFESADIPSVVTIHDVVPFAFPVSDDRARKRQQEPFLRSVQSAKRILTDSEFSKREIVRYLSPVESTIEVVPLAADDRFVPAQQPTNVQKPYILYVGANDIRKNLDTLAAAHRIAFPKGRIDLVAVTTNPPSGVIEKRDVSLDALRELYQQALALAMPSTYEGFGIPPLEAMRCGTPVIASRVASLPEVCGNAAVYVDDPLDIGAWVQALRRIESDPWLRASLRDRGLQQAQQFSWDTTAAKTLEVLQAA